MNKRTNMMQGMDLGKIPPQNIEVEEAILGSILLSDHVIITIIDLLKPEIFYKDSNQKICESILRLHNNKRKVDIMTVTNDLRIAGDLEMVGGAYSITMLTDRVASSANIVDHIHIIYEYYLLREQIYNSTRVISKCYELHDPFEVMVDSSKFLDKLQQGTMTRSEVSLKDMALEAIKQRQEHPGEREILGLSTGSVKLDECIIGFQPGDLWIVAGRPGMGKTAFALSLIKSIGMKQKKPVALFSMEMVNTQIYTRLQASESGIDSRKIRKNRLNEEEHLKLFHADGRLADCPIYIDDTPALDLNTFRAKAALMKHRYDISAIVIDYLQLMKSPNAFSPEQEISQISGMLKSVAKELGIPVIALSQLSREVEKRGGLKIPQLSDLRQSGSIEQDADGVMFLWRPAYYKIKESVTFEHFNIELSTENLLGVVVAKQREGETYNIPLQILLSTMQINDHPALMQIPF